MVRRIGEILIRFVIYQLKSSWISNLDEQLYYGFLNSLCNLWNVLFEVLSTKCKNLQIFQICPEKWQQCISVQSPSTWIVAKQKTAYCFCCHRFLVIQSGPLLKHTELLCIILSSAVFSTRCLHKMTQIHLQCQHHCTLLFGPFSPISVFSCSLNLNCNFIICLFMKINHHQEFIMFTWSQCTFNKWEYLF
jgi:hypothetical protein